MSCEQIREQMSDYLDDELDGALRREVDEHLEGCPHCRDELEGLRHLLRDAAELPAGLEPPRDLWPGIEQRIRALEAPRPGRTPWLAAAAACLAVAIGLTLLSRAPGGVPAPMPSPSTPALQASWQVDMDSEFLRARAELRQALDKRRSRLRPETLAVIDDNLVVIDQAIGRIQAAIERDPSNRELKRLLLANYQWELDLLQKANRL